MVARIDYKECTSSSVSLKMSILKVAFFLLILIPNSKSKPLTTPMSKVWNHGWIRYEKRSFDGKVRVYNEQSRVMEALLCMITKSIKDLGKKCPYKLDLSDSKTKKGIIFLAMHG